MSTIRAYTREFRESAVDLVLSEGLSIRKAADDLGMPTPCHATHVAFDVSANTVEVFVEREQAELPYSLSDVTQGDKTELARHGAPLALEPTLETERARIVEAGPTNPRPSRPRRGESAISARRGAANIEGPEDTPSASSHTSSGCMGLSQSGSSTSMKPLLSDVESRTT